MKTVTLAVPTPSRPYARIRSTRLPSVTTVIGELDKPGLSWGAARETALFAVHHRDRWEDLEPVAAVDVLRKHHRGLWDSAAAWGTLTHLVIEHFAAGHDVTVAEVVEHVQATDRNAQLWRDEPLGDLVEKALGYVVGAEKWWEEFRPEITASEVVVRAPGLCIGTTDLRARVCAQWPSDGFVGEQDVLLDAKTTGRKEETKGYYVDSWSLQLHAYACATEVVHYEATEDEKGVHVEEVGTSPWAPPERLAILHLRGGETCGFYEIPFSLATYNRFTDLCALHEWRKGLPKIPQRIERAEEGARG